MNATLDSAPFSAEQKQYLEGFFAGLAQSRPFVAQDAGGLLTHEPAPGLANEAEEELWFGTPLSDLCKEERFKYDEDPLDIWDKLVRHADEDKFPGGGDIFRFKFHGLFYVAPAQNAFMLRIRVPGSALKAGQLRALAEMARDWGGGYADITTRANFQIREFRPKDIIHVLMKLQEAGLTSRGSGADNIRNITATPTTGFDPQELLDVMPYARALQFYIQNHRDLFGLPRKFNISFDSGGSVSVVSDTNDIGFQAVRVGEGHEVEPGVYFRVLLAGITGHEQFASDCGLLIKPDESVAVAAAMVRVFNEHGDRTNRKKARLKYLIDRWGVEKFVEETEKKLAFPLRRLFLVACEPRHPVIRHGHIGVFRQKQAGLNYVGVVIPVGRLAPKQMFRLADLAEKYGTGELRLTVWQNLLIPHVPDHRVDALKRELILAGLHHESSTLSGGLVACTGNTGCKFASTNTKGHATQLARHLDRRIRLDFPLNIHLTGCPHSCAQHYIGDIGLLGAKVTQAGAQVEGYHVFVGGGSDDTQGIAREVFHGIPFNELPPLLEKMLVVYAAKRERGETFIQFTRRHSLKELQEVFSS